MLGAMASFAEFELHLIRARRAEGIARATAQGAYAQAPTFSAADVAPAPATVVLGRPATQVAAPSRCSGRPSARR